MKKIFVLAMLLIIALPLFLSITSTMFGVECDVKLNGMKNQAKMIPFTAASFFNSEFQSNYQAWLDENIKPRGVLTRTYSTLRYYLFNLGTRTIGNNGDIFSDGYINEILCINGWKDYSNVEYRKEMENYINKLILLNNKLQRINKGFLLYISPSKGYYDFDNIPEQMRAVAPEGRVDAVECFWELIKKTEIPYIVFRDSKDRLPYPAFYPTGIHWSRTFEQSASVRIIDTMSQITGKKYRNIDLGSVKERNTPFWRDCDELALQNLWFVPKTITYYEYESSSQESDEFDRIRWLVQGTSFSQGLQHDIYSVYPFERIYRINRNQGIVDWTGEQSPITSYDDIDLARWLDDVDAVILEAAEPELYMCQFGFVDYLIDYLDSYEPGLRKKNGIRSFEPDMEEVFATNSTKGIYQTMNSPYVWTEENFIILLNNSEILEKGLEMEFSIDENLFKADSDPDIVDVYVNGHKVFSNSYEGAWSGSIVIDAQTLSRVKDYGCGDDAWDIEVKASKSFIPKDLGLNSDSRELAIALKYVGGRR